ncbi:MAG: TonB-dependent receptor [Caulobacter sp.]|nr:TonB-dependent receptor [Caulobacter sp.]
MAFAKKFWIGSASGIALICAASPVWADAPNQDPTAVDEVVVTGIRQSLEKAIQVKRESDNQVDAISATDIGKLPDKNVADALQRLPGVNTSSAASGEGGFDENDRVSIRGTSPSLTQVVIDGHAVATGDWFILDQFQTVGRSVSFDLLPSEVVQGVSVYKTQDASLLEGGVAGLIDIQTRDPLRFANKITMEGSVQGAYNTLSKETRPQINALLGWKNEAGTLGIVVQGFHEERSVRRYGQETLGYTTITGGCPAPTCMATGNAIPSLIGVQAPTLIGSSLFQQEKKRDGGFAAIAFEPNDTWSFNLSGFYSKLNASNTNSNYMYWGSRLLQNSVPTAYTVVNNTLVAATFPAAFGPDQQGLVVDNIVRPDASGKSYYVNLDTTWKFSDKLTFKGQIGYTEGVGDTPTEPAYEVMGGTAGISYARSGNGWVVNPVAGAGYVNPQSPAGLANAWSWNETFTSTDKELYGKIDGVWDVDVGVINKVMFGVRAAKHTRQVDGWDRGCTLGANGQCFGAGAQPYSATNPTPYPGGFNSGALGIPGLLIPITGDPNKIIAILDGVTDPARGPISHIIQPQNYYWPGAFKVEEVDYEGYAMAKVGGDHWRGNFGLRLVGTRETPHANISDPLAVPGPAATAKGDIFTSAYGPYYVTNETHNYFDVLPSVNLTFDLADNVLLRVSAAETMSRPDFSALGGTVSLSDTSLTGSGGNPNLRPVKSASFDFALEYYYGPASVAAISLFYDDLSSYVSYSTSNQVYYSLFYNAFKTYNVSSPVNASGKVQGIELQVQQPIAYGFGFQANATYADGHENSGAPLVGTSRYTYNLVGYYEGHGLSVRAAYTYRSHYFVGLDRSSAENQDNYGTLDASINYQLTPNISINIDALNLTDNLLKYYGANKTQPRAVYENGTQVFAGIRFRF